MNALSDSSIGLLKELAQWYRQNKGRLGTTFRRNPRLQSNGGVSGGGSTNRGIVIVAPTFQDPEAASGTTEYAGSGYYIIRPDGQTYTDWDDTGSTAYTEDQQVTDAFNNRVYTRTAGAMTYQAIAPHVNTTDWTISEEKKIEYANTQYNRETETGNAIKDCVPVFSIGSSVKYVSFTKSDTSVIYLLDESVAYADTPENRTISMSDGAIHAVFQ